MYKYHASYIIVDLMMKIADEFKDDPVGARTLLGVLTDIESLYPDAAKEVDEIYGKEAKD